MKSSIDKLEFSKKITEVEIDSIGNIVDTISIEHLKFDSNGKKRFKEKVYWYKDRKTSWIDYFKPDEDLFFREAFDEEGKSYSTFETLSNKKGEVKKAIQINKEREPVDTTFMDYLCEYHPNGNVKKLHINTFHQEVGELISKIEYDEQENPLFEVMIFKSDTISFQNWEYSDTILQRSVYTNYQKDTSRSIYYFEEEKLLIREEEFEYKEGRFVKSREMNHVYDKSNDRIGTVEIDLNTSDLKYRRFIIEK